VKCLICDVDDGLYMMCGRHWSEYVRWERGTGPDMIDRDHRAIAWLEAQHGPDWYIGNANLTDWQHAYAAVDESPPPEGDDE
jgi:hypothetical protein